MTDTILLGLVYLTLRMISTKVFLDLYFCHHLLYQTEHANFLRVMNVHSTVMHGLVITSHSNEYLICCLSHSKSLNLCKLESLAG